MEFVMDCLGGGISIYPNEKKNHELVIFLQDIIKD